MRPMKSITILALLLLASWQGFVLCFRCPHPDDPRTYARICPTEVESDRLVVTIGTVYGQRTRRVLLTSSDSINYMLHILRPVDGATWQDVADANDPCSMIEWV